MGGLIIPKVNVKLNGPLIFLAGPIIGAPNWHDFAVGFILSKNPDLFVASPRWEVSDAVAKWVLPGNQTDFFRARAWERYYFDLASRNGAVMFWLPKQESHDCKKVYGAMTRFELGQAAASYRNNNSLRFCFGADNEFPELHIIKYDLSLDAPDKVLFGNLKDVCLEAIRLARQ